MLHKKYFIRKSIVYRIWPYIMSIMLVYFVTLTIFPGIESEIYSCRYGDWFPIVLMATFNLTDFIGKLMSALFYRINRMQLLTLSCLRFLLIPLFALSIAPRPHPFFANPIMPVIFSIILGWCFWLIWLISYNNNIFRSKTRSNQRYIWFITNDIGTIDRKSVV